MTIADNLRAVQQRIETAARSSGRDPSDVRLIAVSKTFGLDAIAEAVRAGVTDLGENRAQELKQKVAVAGDVARWHFIGHLQTNKVRAIVGSVELVHSVDRFALAEALDKRARALGLVQDVLIEVNIARDPNRHGVEPARTLTLAREVAALEGLRVRGLMGMAPFTIEPENARPYFKEVADLGAGLELPGPTELSIGMSRDFEVAIEEGATLVRIGEAIFGSRPG